MTDSDNDNLLSPSALMHNAAQQGRMIEAGWHAFRQIAIPPTAGGAQVHFLREAFFAGANYCFVTTTPLITASNPDQFAEAARRLQMTQQELADFMAKFQADHTLPRGN